MARSFVPITLVLMLVLLVNGCSGDNDDPNRVLNLRNGSITEEQLRAQFATAVFEGPDVIHVLCRNTNDDEMVLDLTAELLGQGARATAVPGPADVARVTEIAREECRRLEA